MRLWTRWQSRARDKRVILGRGSMCLGEVHTLYEDQDVNDTMTLR